MRSKTISELVDTVYDDLSMDSVLKSQTADSFVNTEVTFLPDDEGVLKTFIDRYTAMLIHDSVYMEQLPTP